MMIFSSVCINDLLISEMCCLPMSCMWWRAPAIWSLHRCVPPVNWSIARFDHASTWRRNPQCSWTFQWQLDLNWCYHCLVQRSFWGNLWFEWSCLGLVTRCSCLWLVLSIWNNWTRFEVPVLLFREIGLVCFSPRPCWRFRLLFLGSRWWLSSLLFSCFGHTIEWFFL